MHTLRYKVSTKEQKRTREKRLKGFFAFQRAFGNRIAWQFLQANKKVPRWLDHVQFPPEIVVEFV